LTKKGKFRKKEQQIVDSISSSACIPSDPGRGELKPKSPEKKRKDVKSCKKLCFLNFQLN